MEEVSVERLDVERIVRSGKVLVENEENLLARVNVEVSVMLGNTEITMQELLGLCGGDVVELRQRVGDPVRLVYDGQVVARGILVANAGMLGLKIVS